MRFHLRRRFQFERPRGVSSGLEPSESLPTAGELFGAASASPSQRAR